MVSLLRMSCLLVILLSITSCAVKQNSVMKSNTIAEVTTFKLNSNADATAFAKSDAQVENDFTSKQSGFITRQSAIDDR